MFLTRPVQWPASLQPLAGRATAPLPASTASATPCDPTFYPLIRLPLQTSEFQYVTDLLTLRHGFLGPLVPSRPKLAALVAAVDALLAATSPLETALFAAAQNNWTPSGPATVVLPLFAPVTAAHIQYGKLYATAASYIASLTPTSMPAVPAMQCHGWDLWDFLAAPIARMTVVADMAKALGAPGAAPPAEGRAAGELSLAAATCAEDVAAFVSADWIPLLKLNHGSINLGNERLVRFDMFSTKTAGSASSAVPCDVILMQDRVIVVKPDGRSTMVRVAAASGAVAAVALPVMIIRGLCDGVSSARVAVVGGCRRQCCVRGGPIFSFL